MVGKRSCIERITRASTVPSPTPASNTRTAGGRGWMLASSMPTRLAISHFSLQVLTNSRYFCRLSKKRKLRLRVVARLPRGDRRRRRCDHRQGRGRRLEQQAAAARRAVGAARHEIADALERVGGDAAAIAQAAGKLAVVDRAAAEGRFCETSAPAEFADFLQNLIVHRAFPENSCAALAAAYAKPIKPAVIRQCRRGVGKGGRQWWAMPTLTKFLWNICAI